MVGGKKDKIYIGLLLVIFGGIVIHAPLSIWIGSMFPAYELVIKMWKELLMLVAAITGLVILYDKKKLSVLSEPLMIGIEAYGALHVLLLPVFWQWLAPSMAGLMIDLRYILFFALVYVAMRLYPSQRRLFVGVGLAGAAVALGFAVLQVFVLPVDVLKYIGYSKNTIVPYLTVDQNPLYIRINSTFRGPNPLGAYAAIVISMIAAYVVRRRRLIGMNMAAGLVLLALGSMVALWASYSRSAWIAAIVGVGVVGVAYAGRQLFSRSWLVGISVIVAATAGVMISLGGSFVSNVLLHENPDGGSAISSNQGHIDSLQDGVKRLFYQPFGGGVGSTGSASLYGKLPLVIENQYLFIEHEAGWLGLILFGLISTGVMVRLWAQRRDYLALGVFAAGAGLMIIGLMQPVWVDDTVSIVWWGLAGLAVGRWNVADGKHD